MDTDDLDRPVIKYIMIIEFVLTNIYREKIKKYYLNIRCILGSVAIRYS